MHVHTGMYKHTNTYVPTTSCSSSHSDSIGWSSDLTHDHSVLRGPYRRSEGIGYVKRDHRSERRVRQRYDNRSERRVRQRYD